MRFITDQTLNSCVAVVLGCIALLGCPAESRANPSTKNPSAHMKAHGTIEGASARVEQLYSKFDEWEKACAMNLAKMKKRQNFAHSQLSKIYADIFRAIWVSKDLQTMGEPAGADLEARFVALRKAYDNFAMALSPFQQKKIAELKKLAPKRQKELARIDQLLQAGNAMEAEKAIQRLHLSQLPSIFYLTNSQATEFETPVKGMHNRTLAAVAKVRREEFQNKAREKIAGFKDAVKSLQEECTRVAAELASGKTATLADGKTGDAADAIQYVGQLWGKASAAISRSYGVALAYQTGSASDIARGFQPALEQCEAIAVNGLNAIVNSAAQSNSPDELRVLYPVLLKALSVVDRQHSLTLAPKFAESIQKLLDKDPTLAGYVKNYSEATAEPSRWMKRFAAGRGKALQNGYADLNGFIAAKSKPAESSRLEMYGPEIARERVLTAEQLTSPSAWVVGAARSLVGRKVRQVDPILLPNPNAEGTGFLVGRQTGRYYSFAPASIPENAEMTHFRNSLLIDENHAPLDYSSANADSAAERKEFQMVGGEVSNLTMESAVTRLATIPETAYMLVPLDAVPTLESSVSHDRLAIWRVDIEPKWAVHPMFVISGK